MSLMLDRQPQCTPSTLLPLPPDHRTAKTVPSPWNDGCCRMGAVDRAGIWMRTLAGGGRFNVLASNWSQLVGETIMRSGGGAGGAFIDKNLYVAQALRTVVQWRRADINHFTPSASTPYVNHGGGPPSPLPHCNFASIFDYTSLAAAMAAQFYFTRWQQSCRYHLGADGATATTAPPAIYMSASY